MNCSSPSHTNDHHCETEEAPKETMLVGSEHWPATPTALQSFLEHNWDKLVELVQVPERKTEVNRLAQTQWLFQILALLSSVLSLPRVGFFKFLLDQMVETEMFCLMEVFERKLVYNTSEFTMFWKRMVCTEQSVRNEWKRAKGEGWWKVKEGKIEGGWRRWKLKGVKAKGDERWRRWKVKNDSYVSQLLRESTRKPPQLFMFSTSRNIHQRHSRAFNQNSPFQEYTPEVKEALTGPDFFFLPCSSKDFEEIFSKKNLGKIKLRR